jgi:hypothetical protein
MWEAFEEFQRTLTQNFQNADLSQKNLLRTWANHEFQESL